MKGRGPIIEKGAHMGWAVLLKVRPSPIKDEKEGAH